MADPISWATLTLGSVGGWFGLKAATSVLIGGAIVGGAIGALGSFVFDYDFGEGLLFGAMGGLALGAGVGAFAPESVMMVAGDMSYGQFAALSSFEGGAFPAKSVMAGLGEEAAGITTKDMLVLGGVQGGLQLAGGVMSGIGEQGMFEAKQEFAEQQAALDREQAQKFEEMRNEVAKINAEANAAAAETAAARAETERELGFARLDENRRQFNKELVWRMDEFEKQLAARYYEIDKPFNEAERLRNIARETLEGVRIERGSTPEGAKSIYETVITRNPQKEIGAEEENVT